VDRARSPRGRGGKRGSDDDVSALLKEKEAELEEKMQALEKIRTQVKGFSCSFPSDARFSSLR